MGRARVRAATPPDLGRRQGPTTHRTSSGNSSVASANVAAKAHFTRGAASNVRHVSRGRKSPTSSRDNQNRCCDDRLKLPARSLPRNFDEIRVHRKAKSAAQRTAHVPPSVDVGAIGEKDRVWAGLLTRTYPREGWLYLAVVLDVVSRRVVGWSMKTTMNRSLVLDALQSAIKSRRPTTRTLFHSDRGSQYASDDFRALLAAHGMQPSMSGKGECWDNAVVESFFGTMKSELGDTIKRP